MVKNFTFFKLKFLNNFGKAKIFLLILLFFIAGVALASFIKLENLIIYFVVLSAALIFFLSSSPKVKIIAALFFFFVLGVLRYQLSQLETDESKIQFYNGQKIIFQGIVSAEPDIRLDKILLTIKARQLDRRKVTGKVLVSTPLYSLYQYGQILEIECKLTEPENFGRFAYHEYLARYDIYSVCQYPKIKVLADNKGNFFYAAILKFKDAAKKLTDQHLSEPQGALFSAMMLGLSRDLPDEVNNWFRKTGTSHIIAISGLNIMIMIGLVELMAFSLLGLSRRYAFYLTAAFVLFFVVLTGASASVVRAGIMGLLLAYAQKIGRPYRAINSILLTAVLMLLINPKLLRWDAGFQLSFLGILGLIYLQPLTNQWLRRLPNPKKFPFRSYFSTTAAAYLSTLPLILYYFGNLSLSAPLTNILILGVLPWTMFAGLVFLVGGLIMPFLALVLAWPLWLILTYILKITQIFAGLPYFSFNLGQIPGWLTIMLYIVLAAGVIKLKRQRSFILPKNEL